MGIAKPCTHLHPAPSTSTHLHPAPSSSLQHPQRCKNRNIVRNWAISPNLDENIQSCPFCMEIGTHGNLEELIPDPDPYFRNSSPKIHFWAVLS